MKTIQYMFAEWQFPFLSFPPHFPLKILYVTIISIYELNGNHLLITDYGHYMWIALRCILVLWKQMQNSTTAVN